MQRRRYARRWLLAALVLVSWLASTASSAQPRRLRTAGESREIDDVNRSSVAQGLDALRRLEGKKILGISVDVVGENWKRPASVSSVELGEELTGFRARAAIEELLATGRYAQAFADARPFADGAILRLVVVPRRIVAEVRLESGLLDQRATEAALRVSAGSEITEDGLRDLERRLKRRYASAGYIDARVDIVSKDTEDPLEVVIEVRAEAGPQRAIARRIFVIEPRLDRVVGELKRAYRVGAGDPADEEALTAADDKMVVSLREEGFLDAVVQHRLLHRAQNTFLYVYLETGPRYRVVIEGNRLRDTSDLMDALRLDDEGVEAGPNILAGRLADHYRSRGFLDVRVTAEERRIRDDAVVETVLKVVEGRTVRVSGRVFSCLDEGDDAPFSADELGDEIDGVLSNELPPVPFLHAIDAAAIDGALSPGGFRPAEKRSLPAQTYTEEAYAKAVEHLKKLLASKGYLNAVVGPVSVIRAECAIGVRGERCVPIEPPPLPEATCRVNAVGIPAPAQPLGAEYECKADPERSITCSPELEIYLPIHLGPQSKLYDVTFEGNRNVRSRRLLELSELALGTPFSNLELEAARGRLVAAYKDLGYHYMTVSTQVETSPDRTRVRARFVINEHQPVIIDGYEIRGNERTDTELILSRLSLCHPLEECTENERRFRRNLVRESEQQIATLGLFSSVTIGLEDEEIPNRRKRVVITVDELPWQYVEPSAGFYTGDGFRIGAEYGHRNIGQVFALTIRSQFALLPDFLILDAGVRENYAELPLIARLERRTTVTVRFLDIGLGPKVALIINGVEARDNQRDFALTRQALLPAINYQPVRQLTLQFGVSTEVNDVTLFGLEDIADAIRQNPALNAVLRVPDGRTIAFAQRISANWDRRNKPLEASRGTLLFGSVEHVSAFPLDDTDITSEFLRFNTRVAGYIPIAGDDLSVALSFAAGYNLQLTSDSETYPDRLFFLGGVNSLRGFFIDSIVPQDIADQINAGEFDIEAVGVRGGDLYVNPRLELRLPINQRVRGGVFLDTGNLWSSPDAIKSVADVFQLRYAAGLGVRIRTPVGPGVLDFGFPLQRNEWEAAWAFHIGIGLF